MHNASPGSATGSRHSRWRPALTGSAESKARAAFVILLLLGAVAGLSWYHLTSGRYATFEIRTEDPVSGLIAEAPVEFHGVEVGQVKEVQLLGPHSVRILLSVRRDAPVTRATVATIIARGLATRGFTGYVYVALENTGTDSGPLTPLAGNRYPQIASAPSRSLNLDTMISEVKQDVETLTDLLHTVLDRQTVAALKSSIDNLQIVTQNLAANSGRLDAILLDAQRATANAERASRQAKPLLDSSQQTITTLQSQVLPQADETLMNLQEVSASLKQLTTELQRNPSVVVRGKNPPPPGPGEKK